MTQKEKLLRRLKGKPKDLTWDELVGFLRIIGYREVASGHSSGSRQRFIHQDGSVLSFHRPHPSNLVKRYVIQQLLTKLEEDGLL
mgnify:CR=1 FL=1